MRRVFVLVHRLNVDPKLTITGKFIRIINQIIQNLSQFMAVCDDRLIHFIYKSIVNFIAIFSRVVRDFLNDFAD